MSELLSGDLYVNELKKARLSPAVLKTKLAYMRSLLPGIIVIAIEGDDDKLVLSQWIRRVRPKLTYELLTCKGKISVLLFSQSMMKDLSGLSQSVYFFIDRDFDDLAGFPSTPAIFMTDRYAIENYLVSEDVVHQTLQIEYHCHGRPDVRNKITELFSNVYGQFLQLTREHNRRAYVAKRSGIKYARPLPDAIGRLAVVDLISVAAAPQKAEEVVLLEREPNASEWSDWSKEFELLIPNSRYRGKFAFAFFKRWLEKLQEEYASDKPITIFDDVDRNNKARAGELVVSNFASKSELPIGFEAFIESLA